MKKSLVVANGSILFIVKNLMYFNSTKFLQKLYPGFWLINLELLFDYSSLASLEVRLLRTKYKKVSDHATLIVYKFGLVIDFLDLTYLLLKLYSGFWLINLELLFDYSSLASSKYVFFAQTI